MARAAILADIRAFFVARGLLEVETPYLSTAGITDPHIEGLRSRYNGPELPLNSTLYLQTSPEFAMKRLLAAGYGDMFQICRVFRDGEAGRWHNPEFTMLEWYRPGMGYQTLMQEVADLLAQVVGAELGSSAIEWHRYQQLFIDRLGVDPLTATSDQLQRVAAHHRIPAPVAESMSRDDWLDLLVGFLLQPTLGQSGIAFLYDYPASQASLAQLCPDDPRTAQRFEVFIHGVELGNGFGELTHAGEQRDRFVAEQSHRRERGLHVPPFDERLLAAMESGLPTSSGVAIGVDRVIMVALGLERLEQVLSFPITQA